MINFHDILEDKPGETKIEESRDDRLKREDKDLFEGNRLFEVPATLFQETKSRDFNAKTFRAVMNGPNGKQETIGVIFSGQRLEDFEKGALMEAMEAERCRKSEKGDFDSPSRDVDLVGSWKLRTWKDAEGYRNKAFDLVVAAWSYTNEAGERITEGATPTVAAATREEERAAAITSKAQARTEARRQRRGSSLSEIDL